MRAVVDQPHQHEEEAGDHAVAEHLERRAGQPHLAHRRDTQQHVPHVAHAGIGDETLQVLLPQGEDGAVDNAHRRQRGQPHRVVLGGVRQDAHQDTQHSIAAHLQQHPGQDHAHRRRRVGVGVRQPGMERHDWQLDREAGKDEEKDGRQRKGGIRHLHPGQQLHVEGAGGEPQQQEANQHQCAPGEREEHELHRRVLLVAAAPDRNEEVHREQLHFPEEEEEDQVLGGEDPQHARLQRQQPGEVFLRPQINIPGDEDGDGEEEGRQDDHGQPQPVHPQEVLNVEAGAFRLDPAEAFRELESRLAPFEQPKQHQRDDKPGARHRQRH